MTHITKTQIETRRAYIYHRTKTRRVQTFAEAKAFVGEVGFCFFWPIQGVEMPNLFHAIAGRVRDVPMEHDDRDISKCWNWKDQALGQRHWYYAKLLRKRATLISIEFLPVFYALSPNFGDEADYLHEYESGLLSWEAKSVYEALLKQGPLDTVRLQRESRIGTGKTKTSFERALVDLQVGMKILPVGVAQAGAWRYAFVYDLTTRHFPEAVKQAQQLTRSEARATLVTRHVDNVIAATHDDLKRVFSVLHWTPTELDKTIAKLLDEGRIGKAKLGGVPDEHYVSIQALTSG